jgi:hypothetical protein
MTIRARALAATLTLLITAAGCNQVPRYMVSPAKGQTSQQVDDDKFACNLQAQKQTDYDPDRKLTEGAVFGMMAGAAAGAAFGAAAGNAAGGTITGTGFGGTLGGSYLYDRNLNQTQRAYYACLETRGYTLTK